VSPATLRLATRGSELARWQAERVATLLGVPCELVIVSTTGDLRRDVPISSIGGTAAFVKEVEDAVLDGRADLAVHSAKDLPSTTLDGLVLAAVPERADSRDALVGSTLASLPTGAKVGTGSVRRRAQLGALRPDLTFGELRGNIPTRIARATDFDAIVVAFAALVRLGLEDRAGEVLDASVMLPQVAQGALAVECRAGDEHTLALLHDIDDARARRAVESERAFLAELGGGCNLPCGALASVDETNDTIVLTVLLASLDGRVVLRTQGEGRDPAVLGVEVARRLLVDCGGAMLLEDGA
jgi:hydroxymethylbilane synthase